MCINGVNKKFAIDKIDTLRRFLNNKMEFNTVDNFLKRVGVGRLPPDDSFFNDSYETCKVFRRTGITVVDDEDLCHKVMEEFQCSSPHCDVFFRNLADYEIHYNGSHRYTCEECKITRPNARLLEIHIQEKHDSFFEILSQRRSMYQCYVSECNEKFANPKDRKTHCVTIHKFPENFSFESGEPSKSQVEPERVESQQDAQILGEIPVSVISPCSSDVLRGFEYLDITPSLQLVGLTPRLDENVYAKALTQSSYGKKSVFETDNSMDLRNELPGVRPID